MYWKLKNRKKSNWANQIWEMGKVFFLRSEFGVWETRYNFFFFGWNALRLVNTSELLFWLCYCCWWKDNHSFNILVLFVVFPFLFVAIFNCSWCCCKDNNRFIRPVYYLLFTIQLLLISLFWPFCMYFFKVNGFIIAIVILSNMQCVFSVRILKVIFVFISIWFYFFTVKSFWGVNQHLLRSMFCIFYIFNTILG